MKNGKRALAELEAKLKRELKKHEEKKHGKKKVKQKPAPKVCIVYRLSCKHKDPAAFPEIVEASVNTISELVARLEALKEARKKGYRDSDCIVLEIIKEGS